MLPHFIELKMIGPTLVGRPEMYAGRHPEAYNNATQGLIVCWIE